MPNFDMGWPRTACAADNKTAVPFSMTLEDEGQSNEITEKYLNQPPQPEPGFPLEKEIWIKLK